jgi:hypothetical protein
VPRKFGEPLLSHNSRNALIPQKSQLQNAKTSNPFTKITSLTKDIIKIIAYLTQFLVKSKNGILTTICISNMVSLITSQSIASFRLKGV